MQITQAQKSAALHIQNLLMQAVAIAKKEDLILADPIRDLIDEAQIIINPPADIFKDEEAEAA